MAPLWHHYACSLMPDAITIEIITSATKTSMPPVALIDNTALLLRSSVRRVRVAKCHEYDEYIRVTIFRGWGKKV